jgi:hypothetical protein
VTATVTPLFPLSADELETYVVVRQQRDRVGRDMRRIKNWMADYPVGDTKACVKAMDDIVTVSTEWADSDWVGGAIDDVESAWNRCLLCYRKACNRLVRGVVNDDLVQINAIGYWVERGDAAFDETATELDAVANTIGIEDEASSSDSL